MRKKRNLLKLINIEKLLFKNMLRLHYDSILLYRNKAVPSAYHISLLAVEEFLKVLMLDHLIVNTRINEIDQQKQLKWLRSIYSRHKEQYYFVQDSGMDFPDEFTSEILKENIDIFKVNSISLGLSNASSYDLKECNISNPSKIKKMTVKKQITTLSNAIQNIVDKTMNGEYVLEISFDERIFNPGLQYKLKKKWNNIGHYKVDCVF